MNTISFYVKNAVAVLLLGIAGSFAYSEKDIRITITGEESEKNPVHLTLSSTQTEQIGNIRVTTRNLIVANESSRILEGELSFPLDEGEEVIGYALDVNGKLRQGVVVEKDKGRQVFEAVVRQGIDPGLIEKTSGNNFKTRIYPLPAKGIRQVQIVSQSEVKHAREVTPGVFTKTVGKDTYFYDAEPIAQSTRAKTLPKTLAVWWDASASAEKRNTKTELALLSAYLKKLEAAAETEITVYAFANDIVGKKVFKSTEKDFDYFVTKYIQSFSYDGATNLDLAFADMSAADEALVFTDGLANWKHAYIEKNARTKNGKKTAVVYTVNSSPSADHAWLSSYAQEHGGQYINLAQYENDVPGALSLLLNEPYRLIRADYDAKAVSDVFPKNGSVAGGVFTLTGLLKKKSAEITLSFGYGTTVEKTMVVTVRAADGTESDYVPRLWAAKKIETLSASYDKNKTDIIALAKKFGIVTADTSLIVLDSANDYVRYNIVPPKSDKDLYAEYEKIIARQGNTIVKPLDTAENHEIPKSVYTVFKEFKAWWNTSLDEFKKKKEEKKGGGIIRPIRPLEAAEHEIMLDAVTNNFDEDAAYRESAPLLGATQATHSLSRAAAPMAKAAGAPTASAPEAARIQLQAWSPDAAYLTALKKAPAAAMYQTYLSLKKDYGASPAFYMEVSDYFAEEDMETESLRILSNLAELQLENTDILRALAYKLVERDMHALSVPVFEKLVALKGEVPQFLRDLGMAYYRSGDAQKAVDTLYSVAYKKWDGRFEQVQQIALNDMNAIIAESKRAGTKLDLGALDKKLMENFDVDVRIVLTWNTDDCDIDLWVTDKDGEKCYYGNRITRNGGRMSRDFTQGYGPEEFCIKTAPGGTLKIEANYFGNHQQKLLQPVTVQAEVYTNFGRAEQKREVLTLQLEQVKGSFLIGEVAY